MHRSGTSLAANVIQSFGVPMGQNLLPANEYNKWGYFEDTEVVKIHNQLLTDLQRPWGSVRHSFPMPVDWETSKAAAKARKALTRYLKSEIAAHKTTGVWGVKDPRISLFLPLWTQITQDLDVRLKVVLCFRNVEAVAASLLERDNLPRSAGRLLWLQYCAQAITHVDVKTTHIVRYENWQDSAKTVFERMRNFCEVEPNGVTAPPVQRDHIRKFSAAPKGVFANWTKAIEGTDKTHKISAKLKTLAQDYYQYVQVTQIWPRYLDDEVVQKQMSARLEQDLEVYRLAHDKLSEETTHLAKEAAERLADAEEDASKIRAAYDALVETAASHQKSYEVSQGQVEAITAQLSEAQRQYKQSLMDAESYQEALKELRIERDKLLETAQENLAAYQTVDEWLYTARQDLESVQGDLKKSDKKLKTLTKKQEKQNQEIQTLLTQKDVSEQAYDALKNEYTDLQKESAAKFEAAAKKSAAKLEAGAKAFADLRSERDALQRVYDDLAQQHEALNQENNDRLEALNATRKDLEKVQEKQVESQHAYDDLVQQHEALNQENNDRLTALNAMRKALEKVQEELIASQHAYDALAQDHKALEEESAAKLKTAATEISDLQTERDALLRAAQDNLTAYQTVDEWLLEAQNKINDMKRWHLPSMANQVTGVFKKSDPKDPKG